MPRGLGRSQFTAATGGGNRGQVTAGMPANHVDNISDVQAGRLMESLLLSASQSHPLLFGESIAVYLGTYEHVLTVLQSRFVVAHLGTTADERPSRDVARFNTMYPTSKMAFFENGAEISVGGIEFANHVECQNTNGVHAAPPS